LFASSDQTNEDIHSHNTRFHRVDPHGKARSVELLHKSLLEAAKRRTTIATKACA
jgi:hypothetical protein